MGFQSVGGDNIVRKSDNSEEQTGVYGLWEREDEEDAGCLSDLILLD